MPIDQAIAFGIRPVDVPDQLEQKQKYANLAAMAGQQQVQQAQLVGVNQENQIRQQDMLEQQTLKDAYKEAGGDLTKMQGLVAGKVSPKTMMALSQAQLAQKEAYSKLTGTDIQNHKDVVAAIGAESQALKALPTPEARAAAYPASRDRLLKMPGVKPEDVPEQYGGDEWLDLHTHAAMSAKDQIDTELKNRADGREHDKAVTDLAHQKAEENHWNAEETANAARAAKFTTIPELANAAAKGDTNAVNALKILQDMSIKERQASNPNISVNVPAMTPAAQAIYDDFLRKTGQAIAIPRGPGGAQVVGSLNRLGAQATATGGDTPDLAGNKANFAADKTSLTKMQGMRDAVVTFEKTANANLDLFVKNAAKLPDTGVPWLNTPLREIDLKGLGNADVAAVNAARQVANNEIAKVTSNPNLTGALSDSARHEVEAFNPANATFAQTLQVANILKTDMANRHKFLDQGLAEIHGRMKGAGSTAPAAASGLSVGKVITLKNGKKATVTAVHPDGSFDADEVK